MIGTVRPTRAITTSMPARRPFAIPLASLVLVFALAGCGGKPRMLGPAERYSIDRKKVEYPAGFELQRFIVNLTGPSTFTFDDDGSLLVAESGRGGNDPRIYGFKPNGTYFDVYPLGHHIPHLPFGLSGSAFNLYGPIGGMVYYKGKLYVSHRDENGFGVITALDYTGGHQTVVAGLPAQGEHGVTDLVIEPRTNRLFFGVGSATNSGVVGLDDFSIGWVQDHPAAHDIPWKTIRLLGRRFDTSNPNAGLFNGGNDTVVSAPFQQFGVSNRTMIPGVSQNAQQAPPKFSGGIFSVPITGGELRAEAHGIRYPRGLAFNDYGQLYFTNDGMELRGSRPVKNDPDSLLRMIPGTWYGWPDYSTDLRPVTDAWFQPPVSMIIKTGYSDLSFVIDHEGSNLVPPNPSVLLQSAFPSQSGAAGIEFVPATVPLKEYAGNAIVALSGDRIPFGTGGEKVVGPIGRKVIRVDVDRNQVRDLIRNTQGKPGSAVNNDPDLLERPTQVRFAPDGTLYILDFGEMHMKGGREDISSGTGKIYRLIPSPRPTTGPVTD